MRTPQLKCEVVTKIAVDSRALDDFIHEVYKLSSGFSCGAAEEWHNDTSHTFEIKRGPLDKWDQEKVDQLKAGEHPSYCVRAVLTDLANKGLIQEGDYLISECW